MGTIATLIDSAMTRKGWNQPRLAEESGVPQATISRTLKGKTTPETATLQKLYRALGITSELPALGGIAASMPKPTHHARHLVQKVCDLAEQIDDAGLKEMIIFAGCLKKSHPYQAPQRKKAA